MDNTIYEPLKRQHNFEAWHGRKTRDEDLLIWQFTLGEDDFPAWRPLRIQSFQAPGWPSGQQSAWQPQENVLESLVTVNIYELASRPDAHEFLVRILAEFQSQDITRQAEDFPGDVAFSPPGEASLLFARANMVVLLQNGGRKIVPVEPLGRRLDERFTELPQPAPEEQVAPRIRRFSLAAERGTPDRWDLEIDAVDPLNRRLWYKFVSTTGETRLVEGRPVYFPSGAGEQRVVLYAINPNDAAARQELSFSAEK